MLFRSGYEPIVVSTAVQEVARSYRETVNTLTRLSTLDEWYFHVDIDAVLGEIDAAQRGESRGDSLATALLGFGFETNRERKVLERARRQIEKARKRTGERALARLTETGPDGQLRVIDQPPLVEPIPLEGATRDRYEQAFDAYLHTLKIGRAHV